MKTPLSEYTTEELRQELILRRKKPEKHILEYEEFEGIVGYNIHAINVNTMYEYAISNIEALIKIGTFNQDYLEDKK